MTNTFSVGDFVRTLTTTQFSDGSKHEVGSIELITEDTLAYYNTPCNSSNYKKIESQKNSQRTVYLNEIAELASIFYDNYHTPPETVYLTPPNIVSTQFDLGYLHQIPWPMAEVFSYNGNAFLIVEYETDGEDEFDVKTKVVNNKVWLEVIDLILDEVRKYFLYKLLNYV